MPNKVRKIIAGGQTGADRAALDFAIDHGIEIGGYVPKGRLAEDGRISDKYPGLIETESDDPAERTRQNVIHSDATLIFSNGSLIGGSKLTLEFARQYERPFLQIDLSKEPAPEAAQRIRHWIGETKCVVLNIAGPRASEDSDIYSSVYDVLSTTI